MQAAGVPVDFEVFFFSEVYQGMSAPLADVANSIAKNGICLKVNGELFELFQYDIVWDIV